MQYTEDSNTEEQKENIVKDERYMRAYDSFKRPPYYLEWSSRDASSNYID